MTILFDLDGTLIDSTEAILESFQVAFETFGKKAPQAHVIKSQIGHPLDVMFSYMGIEDTQVDQYVDAYKKHYRVISKEKTILLPDAKEAIELASTHATLGIVTTKTGLYSKELLEHMGVMHYFSVLIGREDVTHPKPHPEPVLKALSKLDSDKTACWMIGDTPMDIAAANAAAIESVAVTCGYASKAELLEYGCNIVPNAYEAVKFIIES
ncbi:Phosphoglycolate phosphatase [hydrothermal vent metagenome]|uniref:Phosphoglycolate phosphatase n=1 Tax=hydrothermal vent metagenome TaxID=652676 RepID=A0A1W1EA13_9ZZZZ